MLLRPFEGFRAWVTDDRARLEKCNCDFGGCENAEVNRIIALSERIVCRQLPKPFTACSHAAPEQPQRVLAGPEIGGSTWRPQHF